MMLNESNKATKSKKAQALTADEFTFEMISGSFEERYGHGWKRRLAKTAGVPESNVHSWIKVQKMPPWILRIFQLLIQNARLRREKEFISNLIEDFLACDQVVETDDGFAIYRFRNGLGTLVAKGIPDVDKARELASLPRLESLVEKAMNLIWELRENKVIPEDSDPGSWGGEADELLMLIESYKRPAVLKYDDEEITDTDTLFQDIAKALETLPDPMPPQVSK